ncbi:MAG: hypothetical protein UMR38_03580 [Candidatus Izemoplasma sp.]|nr:hypothetical protein [Candidatus Izemoplasma sp.]
MSEQTKEFGLFIDSLRTDRQISREDLCDGIISLSQYKRYLRGTASIPNNKLLQLADKLKLSISEIHTLFNKQYNQQYNQILDIYNDLKLSKFEIALKRALKVKKDVIVSSTNKMFIDYCIIKAQYHLDLASKVQALDVYSDMINYPACMDNLSFNRIELAILIEIVQIAASMENYEPTNLLYKVLISEDFEYITSNDRSFVPSLYYTLALSLKVQRKYQEVLDICNLGIEYSLTYETSNALAHLLYMKASTHDDLGDTEQALKVAKKAFMQLIIEDKPEKFNSFNKLFENRFNMKVSDIIKID